MTQPVVPIVLCGGSGTRLWPLSGEQTPKQFLSLVTEFTLFQDTVTRVGHLQLPVRPPVVVCNERHGALVAAQMRAVGVEPAAIVLEPAGRNSAPAVAVAALLAERLARASGDEDPLLLVLPADHAIADTTAFAAAVEVALAPARAGSLVTFGVVPTRPETGYGYIACGANRGGWFDVDRFVEKPDRSTAQSYVESGHFLWNSGMFLFSCSAFLRELRAQASDMAETCERALAHADVDEPFTRLGAAFLDCRSDSLDYAVMEKAERIAVVPLVAGWSDVGSWAALHDVLPKDADGNTAVGNVLLEGCRNTYAVSHGRLVAVIGLEGVVVVETEGAVLVVARDQAESVKRVVQWLVVQERRKE
jgi:mannose-1-phosphate guanylyltransferase/mannose-6-phosphate isomerase